MESTVLLHRKQLPPLQFIATVLAGEELPILKYGPCNQPNYWCATVDLSTWQKLYTAISKCFAKCGQLCARFAVSNASDNSSWPHVIELHNDLCHLATKLQAVYNLTSVRTTPPSDPVKHIITACQPRFADVSHTIEAANILETIKIVTSRLRTLVAGTPVRPSVVLAELVHNILPRLDLVWVVVGDAIGVGTSYTSSQRVNLKSLNYRQSSPASQVYIYEILQYRCLQTCAPAFFDPSFS